MIPIISSQLEIKAYVADTVEDTCT